MTGGIIKHITSTSYFLFLAHLTEFTTTKAAPPRAMQARLQTYLSINFSSGLLVFYFLFFGHFFYRRDESKAVRRPRRAVSDPGG